MPKGFMQAQNGDLIEIVDVTARTDVAAAKSQIAKFVQPSGAVEIKENGTFDVLKYAQAIVNITPGGGDTGAGGTPAGTWFGIYTNTERIGTNENGWSIEIPHGLGTVPDWAIVMRTSYVDSTANVAGWIGYTVANFVFTNARHITGKYENVSMQDDAALYLCAKSDVLICKTPGWGGTLEAGAVLMVAVGLNGGVADA